MISNRSSFRIGDKVVYPNHGVAVVEQISSRTVGQNVEQFYLLNIKASNMKVMVPFHNATSIGLRRVVKTGDVQKIVDFLADGANDNNTDWKDRFKVNSDKMRTGGLMEVAIVLKCLLAVHQHKPLSFREKKMLERARYLLVSEVAIAKECEELQVEQLLGDALAKSQLRLPDADELKTT